MIIILLIESEFPLKSKDIENALLEVEVEMNEDHEEAMIIKQKLEKSDVYSLLTVLYIFCLFSFLSI